MGLSCNKLAFSSGVEYFDRYGCEQRRSFPLPRFQSSPLMIILLQI